MGGHTPHTPTPIIGILEEPPTPLAPNMIYGGRGGGRIPTRARARARGGRGLVRGGVVKNLGLLRKRFLLPPYLGRIPHL